MPCSGSGMSIFNIKNIQHSQNLQCHITDHSVGICGLNIRNTEDRGFSLFSILEG